MHPVMRMRLLVTAKSGGLVFWACQSDTRDTGHVRSQQYRSTGRTSESSGGSVISSSSSRSYCSAVTKFQDNERAQHFRRLTTLTGIRATKNRGITQPHRPSLHFSHMSTAENVLHRSPQTSKEGEPQQLSSPRQGAKALERALRMCSEKRPDFSLIIGERPSWTTRHFVAMY